ncbi:MAG: hypothetical protein M3140_06285 [Actinomycetota bacterium]|nr:hypothetical protein [Actinomycetota bacterium]
MTATVSRATTKPTRRLRRPVSALALTLALTLALAGGAQAAAPGSLDSGFGSGGVATLASGTQLLGVAVQPNGEAVAVGGSGGKVYAERFTASGAPDGKYTGASGDARGVAISPDGKIVIAGTTGNGMFVERLTSSLTPDSSFGSHGVATAFTGSSGEANAVALEPDGSVVAAGAVGDPFTQVGAVRFSAGGATEWTKTLSTGNQSVAEGAAVQRGDGKIVLVGRQTPAQSTNGIVVRLNPNGSPDTSFAGGIVAYHYPGGGYTAFNAVALQSNGDIVTGGVAQASTSNAVFARYKPSGSLDSGFGSGGITVLGSAANVSVPGDAIGAYGVGIAAGGRIVGAGSFENTGVEVDAAAWALSAGGSADNAFTGGSGTISGGRGTVRGPQGADQLCALAVAPDGNLVAVGDTVTRFPDTNPCTGNTSSTGIAVTYIGFGPLSGSGGPAIKLTVKGVGRRYKTSSLVKPGLKVRAGCNQGCRLSLKLVISAGTARKLHILSSSRKCTTSHGKRSCKTVRTYRALTLASGSATVSGSGTRSFTLRLSRSIARALGRRRSVGATLQVSATSTATGRVARISKGITLTR